MRNEEELQESPYPSSIYDSLASQARAKNFTILHIVPFEHISQIFFIIQYNNPEFLSP